VDVILTFGILKFKYEAILTNLHIVKAYRRPKGKFPSILTYLPCAGTMLSCSIAVYRIPFVIPVTAT